MYIMHIQANKNGSPSPKLVGSLGKIPGGLTGIGIGRSPSPPNSNLQLMLIGSPSYKTTEYVFALVWNVWGILRSGKVYRAVVLLMEDVLQEWTWKIFNHFCLPFARVSHISSGVGCLPSTISTIHIYYSTVHSEDISGKRIFGHSSKMVL